MRNLAVRKRGIDPFTIPKHVGSYLRSHFYIIIFLCIKYYTEDIYHRSPRNLIPVIKCVKVRVNKRQLY